MSDTARRIAKCDFAAVRRILWEDWGPIGCGVPEDEYDSYVPAIVRLLDEPADSHGLTEHLRRVASESMSCSVPDDRLAIVVGKLLALKVG